MSFTEYDIFEKELEVDCCELLLECARLRVDECMNGVFLEDENDNRIQIIIGKIRKIVENVKGKINAFFTGKQTKKIVEEVQKNPDLKNQKVKGVDHNKISKVNEETMDQLAKAKTEEEMDRIMEKRKKKLAMIRNTVVVVGTLGLCIFGLEKRKNTLEDMKKKSEEAARKAEEERKANEKYIQHRNEIFAKFPEVEESYHKRLAYYASIITDESKDAIDLNNELVHLSSQWHDTTKPTSHAFLGNTYALDETLNKVYEKHKKV